MERPIDGQEGVYSLDMSDTLIRLERLEEVRRQLGLTQAEMARRCGRSRSQYNQWVNGKPIGERLARELEESLGLRRYFLDSRPGAEDPSATQQSAKVMQIGKVVRSTESSTDPVELTPPKTAGEHDQLVYAGPVTTRTAPVVGTAKMGQDGYYEELAYPVGHGDGRVPTISRDPHAYAIRVKGESMHPSIKHGWFVVACPSEQPCPSEYVVLGLASGRKMVKELVYLRSDSITVESTNGGGREIFDLEEVAFVHPVSDIVPPSRWRPE